VFDNNTVRQWKCKFTLVEWLQSACKNERAKSSYSPPISQNNMWRLRNL